MIGTGRTAVGILGVTGLTGDDVVLVTASAGGLGTMFVQAARNTGAVVVGVAGGPEKVERVREMGADVAVDYRESGWAGRVRERLGDREVSVVLDGVGGEAGHAAMELLGIGGRHILFGWSAGQPTDVTTADIMGRGLTVTAIDRGCCRTCELATRALDEAASGRPSRSSSTSRSTERPTHAAVEARRSERSCWCHPASGTRGLPGLGEAQTVARGVTEAAVDPVGPLFRRLGELDAASPHLLVRGSAVVGHEEDRARESLRHQRADLLSGLLVHDGRAWDRHQGDRDVVLPRGPDREPAEVPARGLSRRTGFHPTFFV
jgi:hypothetical protein